jgi:NADH-quinone oxidoreductase subunit N
MAVAALMVIWNANTAFGADIIEESKIAVEGMIFYIAVYLFMNLAAFAIVAFVRNETYREDIDVYNGLISENTATQVLCVALFISFFSLVGIPPFGGFFAKFAIFRSTFSAGYVHPVMWGILAVAAINTVISLFYYVRVLKAIFILPRSADRRPLKTPGLVALYIGIVAAPIFLLGIFQGPLSDTARQVAASLFY